MMQVTKRTPESTISIIVHTPLQTYHCSLLDSRIMINNTPIDVDQLLLPKLKQSNEYIFVCSYTSTLYRIHLQSLDVTSIPLDELMINEPVMDFQPSQDGTEVLLSCDQLHVLDIPTGNIQTLQDPSYFSILKTPMMFLDSLRRKNKSRVRGLDVWNDKWVVVKSNRVEVWSSGQCTVLDLDVDVDVEPSTDSNTVIRVLEDTAVTYSHPYFFIHDLETNQELKRLKVEPRGVVLDFLKVGNDLFVLWEDGCVQYTSTKSGNRWFDVVTETVAPPMNQTPSTIIQYLMTPGLFPLDTLTFCINPNAQTMLSHGQVYETLVQLSFDELERVLKEVVRIHTAEMESIGLGYDGTLVVFKSAFCGYVRKLDILEQTGDVWTLEGVETRIKDGIVHLWSLKSAIDGVISKELMEEVQTESLDTGVDDYAIQVYDKLREALADEWAELALTVRFEIEKVGDVDTVLDCLVGLLQHTYEPCLEDTNNQGTSEEIEMITKSLRSIIIHRFEFIQSILFALLIVKHLDIPVAFTRPCFVKWLGLFGVYKRLVWLANQYFCPRGGDVLDDGYQPATVLEHYIQRYAKLDGLNSSQLTNVCLNILGQIGCVVHPMASLEESEPVIRLATKLLKDIPAHQVLDLLDGLTMSPGLCALKGYIWMELGDTEKSRIFFANAANGIGNADSDLGLVIPASIIQHGIGLYYEHIMNWCVEKRDLELAIWFGRLAVGHTYNDVAKVELLKKVFSIALDSDDFDAAYELLILMEDKEQQVFCLGALIGQLCEAGSIEALCTRFKFAGLSKEVEDALLFKARTESAQISSQTAYHKICYTFFTYRYDFRTAAMVMYNYGRKLSEMQFSRMYTNDDLKVVFTQMSQCFLAALNALSLLDPEQAFFVVPKTVRNVFNDLEDEDFRSDLEIIETDDVRKCYYLSLAKLTLYPSNAQLGQTFQLPDPADVFSIYCLNYQFDHAIQIASLYGFRLDKVVMNSVKVIIHIMNHRPCAFSYKEEIFQRSTGGLLSQAWLTLQMILQEHDLQAENYPYHQLAIKHLLSSNSGFCLPKWLIEPFANDLAGILIRIYLIHSRLQEALQLALNILAATRTTLAHHHNSRWIPATVLEKLLEILKNNKKTKEYDTLLTAFAEYQAELQIVSK